MTESNNQGSEHTIQRFQPHQFEAALAYFNEHGYCVFSKAFDIALGKAFWDDVEYQIAHNEQLSYSLYGKVYQGPNTPPDGKKLPRIIDIESHSELARQLILISPIAQFLHALYGCPATCMQTLTYKFSSEQRAHSDKVLVSPPYVGPYDRETLAASWLALEASSEANGALIIYPGSHKLPKRSLFDGFDDSYLAYTNWLDSWLQENGFKGVTFRAEPGDILFWHGDFIHAGGAIQSPSETPPTRHSLVCHYARIPENQASLDASWTRVKLPGGSYYQLLSAVSEEKPAPMPASLMQRLKARVVSLMGKSKGT